VEKFIENETNIHQEKKYIKETRNKNENRNRNK
jgi:hypothetical protein